jgi:hypothetical protein
MSSHDGHRWIPMGSVINMHSLNAYGGWYRVPEEKAKELGLPDETQEHESAAAKQAEILSCNDPRDEFIFQRRKDGLKFGEITIELRDHPEWEQLNGIEGVYAALKRYCKRKGKDYPSHQDRDNA